MHTKIAYREVIFPGGVVGSWRGQERGASENARRFLGQCPGRLGGPKCRPVNRSGAVDAKLDCRGIGKRMQKIIG